MSPDAFDPRDPAAAGRPGEQSGDTLAQVEFLAAIERYRIANRRPFPTWSEVLEVAGGLGYRKAAGTANYRIVLADCDGPRRDAIGAALLCRGFQVERVDSVAAALTALDPAPQVLVLGLSLSNREQDALLRAIAARHPGPRVAVICADDQRERWERALGFAPHAVLPNPFRIDDVLRVCGRPAVR